MISSGFKFLKLNLFKGSEHSSLYFVFRAVFTSTARCTNVQGHFDCTYDHNVYIQLRVVSLSYLSYLIFPVNYKNRCICDVVVRVVE